MDFLLIHVFFYLLFKKKNSLFYRLFLFINSWIFHFRLSFRFWCLSVSIFLCLSDTLYLCPYVPLSLCLSVPLHLCHSVSMSLCRFFCVTFSDSYLSIYRRKFEAKTLEYSKPIWVDENKKNSVNPPSKMPPPSPFSQWLDRCLQYPLSFPFLPSLAWDPLHVFYCIKRAFLTGFFNSNSDA